MLTVQSRDGLARGGGRGSPLVHLDAINLDQKLIFFDSLFLSKVGNEQLDLEYITSVGC